MDLIAAARSVARRSGLQIPLCTIGIIRLFSADLDKEVESWGIAVLRSPVRTPTANAHCDRLIGSIRRECLDYVIPLNALHLRRILREWTRHYNSGRPHRSLGPGIPDLGQQIPPLCVQADQLSRTSRILANRFSAVCITSIDGRTLHHVRSN